MKLDDFYNAVARRSDTAKTAINAGDTRRVLSEAGAVLSQMTAGELFDTMANWLFLADEKAADESVTTQT